MPDFDSENRYRQALAARQSQRRGDSSVGVALAVVGLIVLGLLVFAFIGDTGLAPADLSQTATGGTAVVAPTE